MTCISEGGDYPSPHMPDPRRYVGGVVPPGRKPSKAMTQRKAWEFVVGSVRGVAESHASPRRAALSFQGADGAVLTVYLHENRAVVLLQSLAEHLGWHAQPPAPEQVTPSLDAESICAKAHKGPDGDYVCVLPLGHDQGHYFRRVDKVNLRAVEPDPEDDEGYCDATTVDDTGVERMCVLTPGQTRPHQYRPKAPRGLRVDGTVGSADFPDPQ